MNNRWLISYAYRATFFYGGGRGTERNAEVDHVTIIDMHPAEFVMQHRQAADEAEHWQKTASADRMHKRVDEIVRIYSAIKVPNEMATYNRDWE